MMYTMVGLLLDGHGTALHALSGNYYRRTDHNRIEKSYLLSDSRFGSWLPGKGNSLIIYGSSILCKKHDSMKNIAAIILMNSRRRKKNVIRLL